jgi:hypothetical protein
MKMATAKLKTVPKHTIGSLCDAQWEAREKKRALEKEIKAIESEMDQNEEQLIEMLTAQGLDAGKGKKGSVSLGKPSVHFSFDDENNGFEKFTQFVAKNKYFHLFQRRISEVAAREIYEQKGVVPGLKPYTKRKLNLTTVNS